MKNILSVLGFIFVLLICGCTITLCAIDEATDEVATVIVEESDTQAEAVEQIIQNLEWTFVSEGYGVPDGYGYGILETVIKNNTNVEIDYIEFNVKFIKDGITVATDSTSEEDVAVGESRKIKFILVPDNFDSYEVTYKSSTLE